MHHFAAGHALAITSRAPRCALVELAGRPGQEVPYDGAVPALGTGDPALGIGEGLGVRDGSEGTVGAQHPPTPAGRRPGNGRTADGVGQSVLVEGAGGVDQSPLLAEQDGRRSGSVEGPGLSKRAATATVREVSA
ncbi:hypothetical protein [Streptomyces sp. NPDC087297]|uniref:hypothetical protein n=1 Tax=Streptomyces sp. NPDC087297 TaxID=3365778 RepID=UPI003820D525